MVMATALAEIASALVLMPALLVEIAAEFYSVASLFAAISAYLIVPSVIDYWIEVLNYEMLCIWDEIISLLVEIS